MTNTTASGRKGYISLFLTQQLLLVIMLLISSKVQSAIDGSAFRALDCDVTQDMCGENWFGANQFYIVLPNGDDGQCSGSEEVVCSELLILYRYLGYQCHSACDSNRRKLLSLSPETIPTTTVAAALTEQASSVTVENGAVQEGRMRNNQEKPLHHGDLRGSNKHDALEDILL